MKTEYKNQYNVNPKVNRVTIRFETSDIELINKVINRFQDMDMSRVIRTSVRKFCPLVLDQGKIEISMIENGDNKK